MKKVFLLLLFTYSSAALALGDPVTDSAQLLGCWKRQVFSDEAMKRISIVDLYDPVLQKYQWFCFKEGGEFRAVTMSKDAELRPADIDKYFSDGPPLMTWKLLGSGVVEIDHKEDPSHSWPWLVSFAASDERIDEEVTVPKGTLFMGIVNKEHTRYGILRVLFKVPDGQQGVAPEKPAVAARRQFFR